MSNIMVIFYSYICNFILALLLQIPNPPKTFNPFTWKKLVFVKAK